VSRVCPDKKSPVSAPKKKKNASSIPQRHREEWADHLVLLEEALAARDMELLKLAKLAAETLKIRQEGERRAWGLGGERGGSEEPASYCVFWKEE